MEGSIAPMGACHLRLSLLESATKAFSDFGQGCRALAAAASRLAVAERGRWLPDPWFLARAPPFAPPVRRAPADPGGRPGYAPQRDRRSPGPRPRGPRADVAGVLER